MNRKNLLIFLIGLAATVLLANCSDKSFTASDDSLRPRCEDEDIQGCFVDCDEAGLCIKSFDYEIDAVTSLADILFVVDNSGSMSVEQREMGTKFPSFLNEVADMDYRIAITTTDISNNDQNSIDYNPPGPNNGNGDFQDGKLIQFASNQFYLDGSFDSNTEQDMFLQMIQRDETIVCENSGFTFDSCPSGDERGLLAAYMTLQNNYNEFVRPEGGQLALIFLSDEDERSQGTELIREETPANFLSDVQRMYPNKSVKAHSIVIRPGDSACLTQQSSGFTPRGFYGDTYAELTSLTGGILGNICEDNFTNQLGEIGEDVAQPRQILPCQPLNDQVTVTFSPEPPYPVEVTQNLAQREILFSTGLPKDTKIRFQFQCNN